MDITVLNGTEILSVLDDLADLRIRVFRDFPYLYDGSADYEKNYLQTYLDCADSIAVLAWDKERLVGASTGLPLAAEVEAFRQPFEQQQKDVGQYFYCEESVLLPAYRGRGVYREFFKQREGHALKTGASYSVFCAVMRPDDHPMRPEGYTPLDGVWQNFGYAPMVECQAGFAWLDIGESAESIKKMQFYLKAL